MHNFGRISETKMPPKLCIWLYEVRQTSAAETDWIVLDNPHFSCGLSSIEENQRTWKWSCSSVYRSSTAVIQCCRIQCFRICQNSMVATLSRRARLQLAPTLSNGKCRSRLSSWKYHHHRILQHCILQHCINIWIYLWVVSYLVKVN